MTEAAELNATTNSHNTCERTRMPEGIIRVSGRRSRAEAVFTQPKLKCEQRPELLAAVGSSAHVLLGKIAQGLDAKPFPEARSVQQDVFCHRPQVLPKPAERSAPREMAS